MTTLHFAYGANMSRAVMQKYAPGARALGVAALADHRFVITADGYASVEPARAQTVHGVLWRITPRDRVMLDAWENVGGGLIAPRFWRCAGSAVLRRRWCISRGPAPKGGRSPATSSLCSRRRGNGICRRLTSIRWKASRRRVRFGPDARKIGEFR